VQFGVDSLIRYWSASTDPGNAAFARTVRFGTGGVGNLDKSNNFFVWCVRGGQGVDTQ
jgi:hypothetical protein